MKWEHIFVDTIPAQIAPRVLYVSIRYRTAKHLCPCGCGSEVVTPIRPNKWSIRFNGRSVSLYPSIGNWSLECKSHYWIRENEIEWAEAWSDAQIERARSKQRVADAKYFRSVDAGEEWSEQTVPMKTVAAWLCRVGRFFRSKK